MKFFLPFAIILLLCSCAGIFYKNSDEEAYRASILKTDYFEEWGLIRSVGYGVVSMGSGKIEPGNLPLEKVCENLFGWSGNIFASRLDRNDTTTFVECYYRSLAPVNTDIFVNMVVGIMLKRPNQWVRHGSLYHVLYGGDSIQIVSGMHYDHKKVCAEKKRNACTFEIDFEKDKEYMYFDGPFYEISLPATGAVRSLTIRTNPKDLEGYKPLKLDPSILPLESPGYKKLREQEEALGRK